MCTLKIFPLKILFNIKIIHNSYIYVSLQAGSGIVEALRTYRHPVFVYIPCGAELRYVCVCVCVCL